MTPLTSQSQPLTSQFQPAFFPFPYFGGKRKVADTVWQHFVGGELDNYIEPFAGSCAVLLSQKARDTRREMINDKNPYIANFVASVINEPKEVAFHMNYPIIETAFHSRNMYILQHEQELANRMLVDPTYYDPKLAGWWAWGKSMAFGHIWGTNGGPHLVDGKRLISVKGKGVRFSMPDSTKGGIADKTLDELEALVMALSNRLRKVRVYSGDWTRVLSSAFLGTSKGDVSGVFLDPPYSMEKRSKVYRQNDSDTLAHDCAEWARANGKGKVLVAYCGYSESEEAAAELFPDWIVYRWTANGGYSNLGENTNNNKRCETIWFSPNCLRQLKLF